MVSTRMTHFEPNHRQEMALQRIDFAVSELATVLMSNSCSRGAVDAALRAVRKAVAPVVADILATD